MTCTAIQPRDCVMTPDRGPWIPPPPPLALDTPIILPDLATLERLLDALRTCRPKRAPTRASHGHPSNQGAECLRVADEIAEGAKDNAPHDKK